MKKQKVMVKNFMMRKADTYKIIHIINIEDRRKHIIHIIIQVVILEMNYLMKIYIGNIDV